MNQIDTSKIVDPNHEQPFTGPSLQFLQEATMEPLNALARAIASAPAFAGSNTPYALVGVEYTGTVSLPATVDPGYILYQNEIFSVFSGFGPATLGAQFDIDITQGAMDPLTFSDGTPENVHNIRKLRITDAASGGAFDLSQVVYIQNAAPATATLLNSYTGTSKYYKDNRTSIVHLMGFANKNPATVTDIIFNLPVGFRPVTAKVIPCVATTASTAVLAALIGVATNGDVSVNFGAGYSGATSFRLDGVCFYSGN